MFTLLLYTMGIVILILPSRSLIIPRMKHGTFCSRRIAYKEPLQVRTLRNKLVIIPFNYILVYFNAEAGLIGHTSKKSLFWSKVGLDEKCLRGYGVNLSILTCHIAKAKM